MASTPSQPSGRSGSDIRIGPITIFAFVILLCMATLAVLSISTAHASMAMTQRQATSMSEMYLAETAAQAFVAELDDTLNASGASSASAGAGAGAGAAGASGNAVEAGASEASAPSPAAASPTTPSPAAPSPATSSKAVSGSALNGMCEAARSAANGQVSVYASQTGNQIEAEFECDNGRALYATITVRGDGSYRIDKWKMTAVTNEAEPAGNLWTGE